MLHVLKNIFKSSLVVMFFCSNGWASDLVNSETESYLKDNASLQDMSRRSRVLGLEAVREKWAELQKIIDKEDNTEKESNLSKKEKEYELKIFVSSSMSKELLRKYVEQAAKYRATLVFNGLPDGSWIKLSSVINEITDSKNMCSIQIDNTAFEEYDIQSVPSFVLSKTRDAFADIGNDVKEEQIFDKVVGNIGIRRALDLFSEGGDMAEEAMNILQNMRGD